MLTPELLGTYNSTVFTVAGEHSFRIGEPLPNALTKWLAEHNAATSAILGAECPYSQPTSDEDNEIAHQALITECNEHSIAWLPAIGSCHNWQERHLFVAGISEHDAVDFCDRYHQNSIVFCDAGGLVRLVLGGSGSQHPAT